MLEADLFPPVCKSINSIELLFHHCLRCDALEHELELQVASKTKDPVSMPSREYGRGQTIGARSLQYGARAAVCALEWAFCFLVLRVQMSSLRCCINFCASFCARSY
jgi:hypothetical protein